MPLSPVPWTPTYAIPRHTKVFCGVRRTRHPRRPEKGDEDIFPDPMSESIAEGGAAAQPKLLSASRRLHAAKRGEGGVRLSSDTMTGFKAAVES